MSLKSILATAGRVLVTVVLLVGPAPSASANRQEPPLPDALARRELSYLPAATAAREPSAATLAAALTLPWTQVVFQSLRDGNWEIYIGNDDGTQERRLTTDGAVDMQPQLRRGGDRVVFTSKRDGDYEIYTINADGSGLTRLTDNGTDDVSPEWSPDGTRIAFQAYRDGQAEIYTMQADGGAPARLTNSGDYDGEPTWSPDGAHLAFVSRRTGAYLIYRMPSAGGAPLALSQQAYSANPAWSPDGSAIAYDADGNGDGWQELYFMNADGSNQHVIAVAGAQVDYWASGWSPDGRYVTFTDIDYIFYQGNWYWTEAHVIAKQPTGGHAVVLSSKALDWNAHWQTQDTNAPSSQLAALPPVSIGPIAVSWSATDTGGAGLGAYDVQVREGTGPWSAWLTQTAVTTANYPGLGGHSYSFRVRARDRDHNTEAWSGDPGAATTVEALPPSSSVLPLPGYTRGGVAVTWSGVDPGYSGIATFDVQYRAGLGGAWLDWQPATVSTSAVFAGTAGQTYYFRARARDRAANLEAWPVDNGDAATTFYSWLAAGRLTDHAGTPLGQPQVSSAPSLVGVETDAQVGAYALYGLSPGPSYSAAWTKPGYGSLPATVLSTTVDHLWDIVLPPADNALQNWDFESSDLAPWLAAGEAGVALTDTRSHTGYQSAWLGAAGQLTLTDSEFVAYAPVASGSPFRSVPDFVVDSAGMVHAVWESQTGYENSRIYYAAKPRGGAWSLPAPINATSPFGFQPSIAIDGADTIYVMWRSYNLTYSVKPSGGTWSAAQEIVGANGYWPDLLSDAAGNLHVAYGQDHVPYVNEHAVLYLYKPAAGPWAPAEMPFVSGYDPQLALGSDGTVYLTCTGAAGYLERRPGGTWSGVIPLGGGAANTHTLAVDATGLLHAAWINSGTHQIEYASQVPGGRWSMPVVVGPDYDSRQLRLAAANGIVHLGLSSYVEARYASSAVGGGWSSASLVNPGGSPNSFARLALEPGGALHLLWNHIADNEIMYRGPALANTNSTAVLSQSVAIPNGPGTATLSYLYQLSGGSAPAGSGLWVKIGDTVVASQTVGTGGWQHASANVAAWAGQTVSLSLEARSVAGQVPVFAFIDEVSVGTAYADVWVQAADAAVPPGGLVTYTLTYGNRGAASAAGVQLILTLPTGVTFVAAQPAPGGLGSTLTWAVGALPARSGPFTLTVTGQAGAGVSAYAALPHSFAGQSASTELELSNNTQALVTRVDPYRLRLPAILR